MVTSWQPQPLAVKGKTNRPVGKWVLESPEIGHKEGTVLKTCL